MQQGGASSDERVAREPFDDPCQSIPVLPCCHGNNKEGRYQKHTDKRLAETDICKNHRQQSDRLCTLSTCNISDELLLVWVWSLHPFGQDAKKWCLMKRENQKLHISSITATWRYMLLTGKEANPPPYSGRGRGWRTVPGGLLCRVGDACEQGHLHRRQSACHFCSGTCRHQGDRRRRGQNGTADSLSEAAAIKAATSQARSQPPQICTKI